MNNDLPWFNGAFYICLDGVPFPDYDAAYTYNVALVSNAYSAFYNPDSPLYNGAYDANNTPAIQDPPSTVLSNGTAGSVDKSGGWDWLSTAAGGVLTTVGAIAKTKLDTQVQLLGIEQQGKIALANQQATQTLMAAQQKYNLNQTPAVSTSLTAWQWVAVIGAIAGIGFAMTQR